MQKGKVFSWGILYNNWEKKRSERKGDKDGYPNLKAEFQRIARKDKKAFLCEQCKETEAIHFIYLNSAIYFKWVDLWIYKYKPDSYYMYMYGLPWWLSDNHLPMQEDEGLILALGISP